MRTAFRSQVALLLGALGLWLVLGGGSCVSFGSAKKSGGGATMPVAFSASQSSLAVSAVSGSGGLASPTLTITNPNANSASYNAATDQGWLVVTPANGALEGHEQAVINVYVNAAGLSSGSYTAKVIVSNPGSPGTGATQIYVTVIVTGGGSAPAVTNPPASVTVDVGQPATFAVTCSGSVTLSYQWQKNGVDIAGAVNSFYTTPPAALADNGATFRAIITNGYGSVISSSATLTVNSAGVAPTVLTQPQSQSLAAGGTATFTVSATGTAPLNYQWQKNSVNLGGATSATYTTPALTLADSGSTYSVTVSNAFGSTTSQTATLTVTAAGVAPTITAQPVTQTVTVGQTATFSVTAAGTAPLTYQWYLTGKASDLVISGATNASYTTPAAALGDNELAYRCKVTNAFGMATSAYARLYVQAGVSAPNISVQPASQTVSVGQAATFSVTAAGTAPLLYQWQKNGVDIGGAQSASYTTPATTAGDTGAQYRAIVSNDYGTVTSVAATLTVNTTAPAFSLSSASLNFSGNYGGPDPATQLVNLSNSGTGGTQLNWTAASNASWLSVSPGSGITPTGPAGLTIGASLAAPAAWTALPAAGTTPSPRETFSVVWTGTHMLTFGGWDQSGVKGDGYSFNPATNLWTAISSTNAPIARNSHVAVWTGTEMIVWGGYDSGGNYLNTGGRYNPATNTWSATAMSTTNAPTARRFASAVWTGTEMIVWGGADVWNGVNTGGRYNPATNSWSLTPPTTSGAPSGRTAHSAIWAGTEMIVWGGTSTLSETDALQNGGRYNPASDSWSGTAIATGGAPAARFGHIAAWTGSRMIVWGGSADLSTRLNDGAIYDPASNAWTGPTPATGAPTIRHHHGAVWTGTEMVVWGGYYGTSGGSHLWHNDGGRLNLTGQMDPGVYTGQITLTDPAASNNPQQITVTFTIGSSVAPSIALNPTTLTFNTLTGSNPAAQTVDLTNPTAGSSLKWTAMGDKPWLQVSPFSGTTTTGTGVLSVNAVASQSEAWTGTTTTTGAPTARTAFSTVWTGKEMIIWGGGAGSAVNTGGRYNPATNTWAPVSTVGAPSARFFHAGVWTGSRMLIWSGTSDGSSLLTDGGSYDPATDTWSGSITATGAPSGRMSAQVVWTGSEMIVWSGTNGSAELGDGKRYNPATDSWSAAMSTVNAPLGRRVSGAVWTGTEMVVWGGVNGPSTYLNDGGRYNPGTDTWSATPISLVGAPSARANIAIAWTGTEMVVWGGYNGGNLNDGARYNPASNTWIGSTTATGAPGARRSNDAVWTGQEMILWGGYDSVFLNTGYRYRPAIDLAIGTYTANLTVRDPLATNNPQTVAVTVNVTASVPPSIALNPTTLTFNAATGSNPAAQTVNLTNPTASSTLNWTTSVDQPWLTVSPTNGTTTTGTSVLTVNAVASQADAWTGATTTTGAPSNREVATAVWTGSEMIVFGGGGLVSPLNDGAIYNPTTNIWRPMSSVGAPTVFKHVAVWTGSKMIVWGGSTTLTNVIDTGAIYDPATDTWSGPLSMTNAPSARRHASAVWTGTEMVVWGGDTAGGLVNDGGRYNPATDSWSATAMSTVNAPTARFGHTAVWSGTEMIVWAGYDGAFLNTGGRYNPATNTWSATPVTTSGAPTSRAHHSAVWTGDRMIVWGGSSDGATRRNDGALYDPATNNWTGATTQTGAPGIRHGHIAVWTGNEMIVWGGWWGSGGSGHVFLNDGGFYRPAINLAIGTYTANLTVRDPLATNNPQTVAVTLNITAPLPPAINLSQTTLNFTGGVGGPNPAAQTSQLTNPSAGSTLNWTAQSDAGWLTVSPTSGATTSGTTILTLQPQIGGPEGWTTTTTATGAPSIREGHCAVWTGTQMVLWGGNPGTGGLNTGGRYTAGTDSWQSVSTTSAPSARHLHTGVWTGSQMLVFGGDDGFGTMATTGGTYNPATNTWTGMSMVNAPAPRRGHSAIWTGSEMIVWGGFPDGTTTTLNSGARYNPATDTWNPTPISTTNAPTARGYHTAIWTGSEMIVWGGYDGTNLLNDGHRYNPATDTWNPTPISTTGAPTARELHSAVWTGRQMVIWGGDQNAAQTAQWDTGAVYEPATDTWTGATSLTGVPAARHRHSAVWTGSEMIVWGGWKANTNSFLNDGKRYTPPPLPIGSYTGHVSVSDPAATNNPQQITVNLTVVQPALSVSPTALTYDTTSDDLPTITLQNTTAGTLSYTVTSDQSWLIAPPAGSVAAGTPVTFLPDLFFISLAPGSYTAHLTITAPGATNSPQTVTLTLTVGALDSFEAGASYLRDVYVAETGNDTTGDGTPGNPYRSPHKALAAALPGDNIHVLAGTFPAHGTVVGPYALGTYANPIKIGGDPAGGTVIDCAGGGNGLYNSGLTFLIVENLEIVNFSAHGISFDGNINARGRGHHLILRNLKVHNPQATAVDCIKLNNTDCSIIEHCDTALNNTAAGGSNAISTRFSYHNIIRRNYVHDSTLFGIRFGSNSRDNLAYANKLANLPDRGINLTGMRNLAVANLFVNVKNPLAFESAEEPVAAHNTIYRPGQVVLWFSKNVAEPTETRNGRIVNNLVVFNNADLTNYCNNGASTFPATFTYENNLWYSLDTPGFAGPTNTAAAEIAPLYQVDPLFVNAAGHDFHLQAGSGARANGATVAQAPKDYDSTAFASPPARGAFEGLTGPAATLSLSSTTVNLTASVLDPTANTLTANVSNVGAAGSTLHWTATGTQPWLKLTPGGGTLRTGPQALQISANVTQAEAWTGATATAYAPTGREDFSAVWTGREMLVWGGSNGSVLQTGGRYNPATNIWAALPTAGAPAARRLHTAVWTGSHMIVWGGLNTADLALNDGARFDPTLNAWVGATSLTAAPAARRSHVAVFTGSEMIVWGGFDQSGATILNDGKRYNPATDTWTTVTSLTNAPTARYTHTAVWTGSEMIVWGGFDGGYTNSGGRYNPATDTWAAGGATTVGAPTARGVTSAVWDGRELILWGGSSTGSNVLNDGLRYNPATDSWSAALATSGQPAARRSHCAVWTGREMLVWGGFDGGYTNTGGRYAPPISLAAGLYTDTITVTAPGAAASPQTIAVTLTVNP